MVFSLVAFLLKHPMYPSFHNHGSEQLPERKLILERPIFHFHEYGRATERLYIHFLYTVGSTPQVAVTNEGLSGFPTKN